MARLLRRVYYWLRQRDLDAALQEELDFHQRLKQQELEANGLAAGDAEVAARRAMGNVTLAREHARAEWIWPWLESVWQDARHAVRALVRQPGFTLVSVIILGVAIGLNTSLFTVFAGAALRPMPGLTDPDRVVTIWAIESPSGRPAGLSYPEFQFLAADARTLTGLSATRASSASLEAGGAIRSTVMNGVSGNYFDLLGVRMEHGRGFLTEEDREGAPASVVVLSYRLWETRFDANPMIVGTSVLVNDVPHTVVGVTRPEFMGSSENGIELWVPIASIPLLRPHDPGERDILTKVECCINVLGRLADHVTRQQAEAELQVLSNRFRDSVAGRARPITVDGTQFMRGGVSANTELAVMAVLFVGLVLVLLLACANVGNLVLARSAARAGEIGVRMSLGAGRRRIVRQLLTEGLVLALLASLAGFAVAIWVPDLVLNRLARQSVPFDIDPDVSVLLFAFALAAVACATFALAPALHATRQDLASSLRQVTAARSSIRMRSVLLGVQVAITVVLLTSAGLLLRGVNQAGTIDPGFRVKGLELATFELPEAAYDHERARTFLNALTSGLRDAGIDSFGFTMTEPFGGRFTLAGFRKPGEPAGQTRGIEFMSVSPDFFPTIGLPMVAGRAFDASGEPGIAIVNETAARRHWPGQDVVGQTLLVGRDRTFRVIGVVQDAHLTALDGVEPLLFLPLTRPPADDFPRLLFDATAPSAAATVAAVVARLERRARVEIRPLDRRLDEVLAELALAPLAASVLGVFGLGLAAVGMFGVFGYVVRQRTREIGIRIALGARAAEIIRLVVAGSSRPVIAGLVVGILGALGASQVLRSKLYGVSPLDPFTYAGVALLLGAAAMAASYLPARRAVRLNPTQALRE